jgi:hypothetical protein
MRDVPYAANVKKAGGLVLVIPMSLTSCSGMRTKRSQGRPERVVVGVTKAKEGVGRCKSLLLFAMIPVNYAICIHA